MYLPLGEVDHYMTEALYLSGHDLEGLATIEEFVETIRKGFMYRGEGAPAAAPSAIGTEETFLTTYTASFPEWSIMGGYMYGVGDNVWYTTPLFDSDTGELLAVLDGAQWNPKKTGAVAAVATDELAKKDASTVGVLGSSNIAWASLAAVNVVRDIDTVIIYSPTEANRKNFAKKVSEKFEVLAEPVDTGSEVVTRSDIINITTSASEPVISGSDITSGTHLNAMGAAHPKKEVDIDTFSLLDKYVPDQRDRVFGNSIQQRSRASRGFLEAFDNGIVGETSIYGELGSIVSEQIPGRTDNEEITLFDSIGTGIETVAAAYMLYKKAIEAGKGTPIQNVPKETRYGE